MKKCWAVNSGGDFITLFKEDLTFESVKKIVIPFLSNWRDYSFYVI